MPTFFPNSIDELIINPQFRNLFVQNPMTVSTGIYYGFPACCIEHFCQQNSACNSHIDNSKKDNHPMLGTGYLPCPQCYEDSKNKEFFTQLINNNRFSPLDFPAVAVDIINEDEDKFFALLCYKLYKNPLEEIKSYSKLSYLINEIDTSNKIYLYTQGYKINVSAINIKDKNTFMYMVENNQFHSTQLEKILEWQKKQDLRYGNNFPFSIIMQNILQGSFALSFEEEEELTDCVEESNTSEDIDMCLISKQHPNISHFHYTNLTASV